ncbi:hypothetical protein [Staphylococcus gallinarum]|uniref:hypothetical protein n=1 Tax=Staphylococcus gallinarum TaxID=1293 RepID=UPI002DB783EB|nr:hypothetical protein [Staphylococcus gallinarum]MEB7040101.1 hypothetical protein [Staphylococcus gallinarum]
MNLEKTSTVDAIFGKNRDQNKEHIIVVFITLYIGIRSLINQDFIYLLTFFDLKHTINTVGNILNDLIMAYIPIGVLILTTQGAKYKASKIGERIKISIASFLAPIILLMIFYVTILLDNYSNQSTNIATQFIDIILVPLKLLTIFGLVFGIIFSLSLLVNNIIMIIFQLLENHKKELKTIDIGEDIFIENNYTNAYNYWYYYEYKPSIIPKKYIRDIFFVKVYIKSKQQNKAIINVYFEDDTLIISNKKTEIIVKDGMKATELEEQINVVVKSEIENIIKQINSKKQS